MTDEEEMAELLEEIEEVLDEIFEADPIEDFSDGTDPV